MVTLYTLAFILYFYLAFKLGFYIFHFSVIYCIQPALLVYAVLVYLVFFVLP